jgi:hypothetical protein
MPKWKAASMAFRANLKQAQGKQVSNEEKQAAAEVAQEMVLCNNCGRKFNSLVAERHVPFC